MINEQVVPVGTTWIERGCERTAAISRAQGIMLWVDLQCAWLRSLPGGAWRNCAQYDFLL